MDVEKHRHTEIIVLSEMNFWLPIIPFGGMNENNLYM
jgi:hypothetical protein